MIRSIYSLIPNPEDVLALEPEELAGVVLAWWNSIPGRNWNRSNFGQVSTVIEYPEGEHKRLLMALIEAWVWLEREGLIAPMPGQDGWYFVTRQGMKIKDISDLEAYRNANMLPKRLIHPIIAQKTWAPFLRGDYDTAVFQAFKEVEVRVRSAGGFLDRDLGTALMRNAFNENGSLTDQKALKSEQEAMSNLFAGAIGSYKNPPSHRNVEIDAVEAVELIMLASHLMKIVDSRSSE